MSIKFEVPAGNRIVLEEVADCLRRIAGRLDIVTDAIGKFATVASEAKIAVEELDAASSVVTTIPDSVYQAEGFAIPAPPVATEPVIPTLAVTVPVIPTPPPVATGVQLDSEGLPWDQRIHAGSKTFRQSDNTWKLLKNVDKGLVEQVKAELRLAMGAVAAAPPVPVTLASVAAEAVSTVINAVIPTTPAAVIPPPPAPVATSMTFPEMLEIVKQHMADGTIAMTEVSEICKKHGFAAFPLIGSRPDMIPTVLADMEAVWQSRQPMLG